MPFPGGIAASGSKAGSRYKFSIASTYAEFCPTLREKLGGKSKLPPGVDSIMEVIINGRDLETITTRYAGRDRSLGRHARPAADLRRQLRRPAGQEFYLSEATGLATLVRLTAPLRDSRLPKEPAR